MVTQVTEITHLATEQLEKQRALRFHTVPCHGDDGSHDHSDDAI